MIIPSVIVALQLLLVHLSECRGPHHPRGESVVKRHVHYRPTKDSSVQIAHDEQLLHDREHIQEHLDEIVPEVDISNMTDEELEFYYFQLHDTDKNSKLDGLELLKAILHTVHGHDETDEEPSQGGLRTREDDEPYFVELIDHFLTEDDLDGDGYLTYAEYASGRKKAVAAERASKPVVKMVP